MQDTSSRTISAFELRRSFGKILFEIVQGKSYVVKKNGNSIAALIPISDYKKQQRSRDRFFELLEKAQNNANLSPEKADKLAAQAVKAVRAGKK